MLIMDCTGLYWINFLLIMAISMNIFSVNSHNASVELLTSA